MEILKKYFDDSNKIMKEQTTSTLAREEQENQINNSVKELLDSPMDDNEKEIQEPIVIESNEEDNYDTIEDVPHKNINQENLFLFNVENLESCGKIGKIIT